MRIMKLTSLEKVGTAKYWLGKRSKSGNLARGSHRYIEEALQYILFLALFFVWNESVKVLYYKRWKHLN